MEREVGWLVAFCTDVYREMYFRFKLASGIFYLHSKLVITEQILLRGCVRERERQSEREWGRKIIEMRTKARINIAKKC